MPISHTQLLNSISKFSPTVIETIKELVKVPTVTAIDSVEPIHSSLSSICTKHDLPHNIIKGKEEHETGFFVGNDLRNPDAYIITSGYSTVAIEEELRSRYDPFTPVVDGDNLYGSGAWKNKGNVALTIFAKKIIDDLGYPNLVNLLYTDEVGSNLYAGIKTAINQGLMAKMHLVSCPLSIDSEDNKALMYTGCRGFLKYKLIITKKKPDDLLEIWKKKTKLNNPIEVFYEFWRGIQDVFGDNQADPTFPSNTTNNQTIFGLNAGTGDAIPSRLVATINLRSVFSITHREYLHYVKQIADKISQTQPYDFEFEVVVDIPAVQLEHNSFIEVYEQNINKVLGFETKRINDPYTDGIYLTNTIGLPVGYAVALSGKNQNSFDEYVDTKDISKYLEVIVTSILQHSGVEIN